MIKNIVLYHNNCDDGFGAAWAAWKKFGSKAKYIGVQYGESVPDRLENKDVFILDFCYPLEITKKLLKITSKLVVIDHHISNRKTVEMVPAHIFDATKHSGAYLAWKYFHSKSKTPILIKYIEDADLWHWKMSHSREISSVLRSYDMDFKIWNKIAGDLENTRQSKQYATEGKAILRADKQKVEHTVAEAELVEFCGYKTMAVNSFHLSSQIGHMLYAALPPIGIIWSRRKNITVVSLRSNGKVDVSKLAKKFGGGGHKEAAAFELAHSQKLPWKAISDKLH